MGVKLDSGASWVLGWSNYLKIVREMCSSAGRRSRLQMLPRHSGLFGKTWLRYTSWGLSCRVSELRQYPIVEWILLRNRISSYPASRNQSNTGRDSWYLPSTYYLYKGASGKFVTILRASYSVWTRDRSSNLFSSQSKVDKQYVDLETRPTCKTIMLFQYLTTTITGHS